jgi:hypothetical protein
LEQRPTFGYTLLGVVNFTKMTQIQDDYRHLNFKKPTSISELKVGMMVQIVENNKHPLCWQWFELTEKLILILNSKEDGLKWVRLPNYA